MSDLIAFVILAGFLVGVVVKLVIEAAAAFIHVEIDARRRRRA